VFLSKHFGGAGKLFVISKKMKALSFRTIFLGLLLALGSFYFIAFVHNLLDMFTQIRLKQRNLGNLGNLGSYKNLGSGLEI
jgi:hypothetical protein